MNIDRTDFVRALERYVAERLRLSTEPPEYNHEALRIVDARNHLFADAGVCETDEEHDIYTLRALCRIDEETLEVVPNRERLERLARHYFG